MKNILKLSLVIGALIVSLNANASDVDFSLNVTKVEGRTISFTLNKVQKIDLTLLDQNHQMVYSEHFDNKPVLKRTYNFAHLPNGTYFLEAETPLKVVNYVITVSNDGAEMNKKEVSEMYKPVVAQLNNGLVSVNLLSVDHSPLEVKVYDDNYNLVYNETLSGGFNLGKRFDFSKSISKDFTFVMSYKDKTFTKNITVK
ncbi:hypothetical protein ACG2LH_10320 [Zhouia sp. PK063]|uniref:hypothetical protein n=1 Tax=Zhouia sp. PK063 TaxID=3373602 RepID=UPI0037AD37D5